MSGTLYLIPTSLGPSPWQLSLPSSTRDIVCALRLFAVENAKSARAALRQFSHPIPVRDLRLEVIPNTPEPAWAKEFLRPVTDGKNAGILSEAGCPGVADPGAEIVRVAHEFGIRVVPLVGPSALLLALMASGLNGQRFAFHGYLPIEEPKLIAKIRELELASARDACTQIFIEAPYRNMRLLRYLLDTCATDTQLVVACDLTLATESIDARSISAWRGAELPQLDRRPAVFLILSMTARP